jgi:hypothetical protein
VLFGFLILTLSLYQVQVVPQQNAQTEFDHFQEVQNEFTVLRNAISRAGQNDLSQYDSIQLGTPYQSRIFTINPPPAVGTLRTTDPYNMTIGGTTVQSRFLQYRDGYNEIPAGSLWYDNSVVYLETDEGQRVIYEDQNLVTGGGQVRVTALQNAFQESGVGRQTVELFPVENATVDAGNLTGEIDVRLPTRLNGSYWNNEIPPSLRTDSATAVNESAYPTNNDVYGLELTLNASSLRFNTVGVNSVPEDVGESLQQNVGAGSGGSENSGDTNGSEGTPGGAGERVVITQAQINSGDIVIQFRNNNPSQVEFIQARLDSYSENNGPPGSSRTPINRVIYNPTPSGPELVQGDPLEPVGGPTINSNSNQGVTLSPQSVGANGRTQETSAQTGDVITFTIEFSDGSTETYTRTL